VLLLLALLLLLLVMLRLLCREALLLLPPHVLIHTSASKVWAGCIKLLLPLLLLLLLLLLRGVLLLLLLLRCCLSRLSLRCWLAAGGCCTCRRAGVSCPQGRSRCGVRRRPAGRQVGCCRVSHKLTLCRRCSCRCRYSRLYLPHSCCGRPWASAGSRERVVSVLIGRRGQLRIYAAGSSLAQQGCHRGAAGGVCAGQAALVRLAAGGNIRCRALLGLQDRQVGVTGMALEDD